MKRILVVDDEKNMRMVLSMLLENAGYSVHTASDGKQAIGILEKEPFIDLVITDLKMPGIDGMGILNHLKIKKRDTPLVMITAYGTIEKAVEAIKRGAMDFITKPFNKEVILHIVNKLFQNRDLVRENTLFREKEEEAELVYKSRSMREIMETVQKIALSRAAVLIIGESGTGKDLVAKAIHRAACSHAKGRPNMPFVSINCPAVPETLIESELFGYKKGTFTGAVTDYRGKLALADNGILFLDEIADLPLHIQPKLLRFLEDKTFEPLGTNQKIKIEARIICATNRDLKGMVEKGKFREDLYFRINTFTISLPPLKDRPDDIIPLASFFLKKYVKDLGRNIAGFSQDIRGILLSYQWPGNIRELRNIIERAVVLAEGPVITAAQLPADLLVRSETKDNTENKFDQIEKQMLVDALKKNNGNVLAAAKELGLSRGVIRYRMKKYRLRKY